MTRKEAATIIAIGAGTVLLPVLEMFLLLNWPEIGLAAILVIHGALLFMAFPGHGIGTGE